MGVPQWSSSFFYRIFQDFPWKHPASLEIPLGKWGLWELFGLHPTTTGASWAATRWWPSGLLHSELENGWTWHLEIVDYNWWPIKDGDCPVRYVNVYQRVTAKMADNPLGSWMLMMFMGFWVWFRLGGWPLLSARLHATPLLGSLFSDIHCCILLNLGSTFDFGMHTTNYSSWFGTMQVCMLFLLTTYT